MEPSDILENERTERDRIEIIKRMRRERYREALHSFLNGDTIGT